jgi:hypothetical protein
MKEKWNNVIAPGLIIAGAVAVFIVIAIFLMTDVDAAPVAGQPETFTEKYQCPFYENVDAKGCVPPPNLTCNADWTVCTPKEDASAPISTPETPPAASQAVVSTPTPVKKGCYE